MTENQESFIGIGWSFPPEFNNVSNEVEMVKDNEDIMQSLYILLSTNPGERIMNPEFGCGIKTLVFESLNESIITLIKDKVEKAILFFEPRITLEKIDVGSVQYENGLLDIKLDYTIRKTNTRSNMVYPYYFREGTNL